MDTFILADNQDITRFGLRTCVKLTRADAEMIETNDRASLLKALENHPNAVVILDYTQFDLHGADDLIRLESRFPYAQWVLFSYELSGTLLRRMVSEPAVSLLLKECSSSEIIDALRSAAAGQPYHCRQVKEQLLAAHERDESCARLTPAEREVLQLIAQGKVVKEIAELRHSSVHTITTHKKNLFRKLKINNVYEATRYALRAGLVEMAEYYI